MWFILCSVTVLIWVSISWADTCSHLPGYTVHGTSCFKVYTTTKTWAAAEASCVADGGHLASIHSSEEQDFVANLALSNSVPAPWIGLSGILPNLGWSDGTGVNYENWAPSEPDRNDVGCIRINAHHGYRWQDIRCSNIAKYVCRADQQVDQTKARFMMVPGGMDADPAVSPSPTDTVRSRVECAWRCQQDAQCVHFIMSEGGGKYLCETYSSLYRPLTAAPPTDNYEKVI